MPRPKTPKEKMIDEIYKIREIIQKERRSMSSEEYIKMINREGEEFAKKHGLRFGRASPDDKPRPITPENKKWLEEFWKSVRAETRKPETPEEKTEDKTEDKTEEKALLH